MRRVSLIFSLLAVLASLFEVGCLIPALDSIGHWPLIAGLVALAATLAVPTMLLWGQRVRLPFLGPVPTLPSEFVPINPVSPVRESPNNIDSLENRAWVGLVEECVACFDEVDRFRPDLDGEARDLAEHLCCRIQEFLQRSGVTLISGEPPYESHRHQLEPFAQLTAGEATSAETISPGFAVGRRVFRRARVRCTAIEAVEKGSTP